MKVVIDSVVLRYKQFLVAGCVIFIFVLFYALLSFLFFRSEFFNYDLNENTCDSFLICTLNILNFGMRAGSLGFGMKSIHDPLYWPEFFLDWFFYFSCILILLNVINGIIVDTFQQLREDNIKIEQIKNGQCFICSIKCEEFEIKGIDFQKHLFEEHRISNYFHYIVKLKKTDEFELNAIDYQVFCSIKERKMDFIPIKRAICITEDEEVEEENEECNVEEETESRQTTQTVKEEVHYCGKCSVDIKPAEFLEVNKKPK
jgi:hypothetical protein